MDCRLSSIILLFFLSLASCTTFHKAANTGDIDKIKSYVDKGSDINVVDRYGYTPLISASENGHLSVVKVLVENGANLNVVNNAGDSALNKAAYNGYTEIVKYLVNQGATVDIHSSIGTALYCAAWNGHVDIVKYLIENGADINISGKYPVIIRAAKSHNVEVVKYLANCGAKISEGKALVVLGEDVAIDGKTDIAGFEYYMGLLEPGKYTIKVKYNRRFSNGTSLVSRSAAQVEFNVKSGGIYVIESNIDKDRISVRWPPRVVTY